MYHLVFKEVQTEVQIMTVQHKETHGNPIAFLQLVCQTSVMLKPWAQYSIQCFILKTYLLLKTKSTTN